MIDDRRVHDLVGGLLAIPPAERAAWLAREVPDDPDLRARLLGAVPEQPLDAADDAPASPVNFARDGAAADDALIGQCLGPFAVEARLSEQGGMGIVYRGRRVDGAFAQDVAIKIIPRGRDTDGLLRRFSLERRVLGVLQHPNIVRILDAGAVADGRPYLVMEWVDGLPLDRFCAERQLNLAQRLALFQDVAGAVQYAHEHLVVHRDLKPGNILVTAAGAPKILDFGLAKVLDDDEDGIGLVSRTNERPMTPAYASPEQVRGDGVTTATDVYALGLILYELLTGRRPYRLTSSTPTEIERVICEEEPPPPSRAPPGSSSPDAAVPPVPPQRLRGELDAIVMRALEKQPRQRYPTVAALSDDAARYLDGRPVLARQSTLGYRAAKFAKRHARSLTAAAVVVLLAAAFVVQNAMYARRLAVERDRAQASLKFLVSLFQASDPDKAKGSKITAAELLDEGVKRLGSELQNQPATRASLLFTLGDVYERLGRYDAAEPLLVESIALQRQLSNRPTLELADAINALGRLYGTTGDRKKGGGLYDEALAIRRSLLPADDPLVAKSMINIASTRYAGGDYSGAVAGYREAFTILKARNDPDQAMPLVNISAAQFQMGKYAEAAAAAREAWQINQRIHGPDHSTTMRALAGLGWAQFSLGDHSASERTRRDVLERSRRMFGDAHVNVAEAWYTLGHMLGTTARLEEAETALREGEAVWRKLPGVMEDRAAWTYSALAGVLSQRGKYDEAVAMQVRALELRKRSLGEKHPDIGESVGGLGDIYYRQGRWSEAEKYFRMNLEFLRAQGRSMRWQLAFPETALGRLLSEQGRVNEAEPLLRHALEGLRQDLPPGHDRIAFAEVLLGDCLRRRRQFDAAQDLLDRGMKILKAANSNSEQSRYAEDRMAALLADRGRLPQAAATPVSPPKKPSQ
jgi:eukaryotic-like serine/threonine-protein kinase